MSLRLRRLLFEWEDLPGFPAVLRGYMLDFLTFFLKTGKLYAPITPLLLQKLRENDPKKVWDLASGGAGPLESLLPGLVAEFPEIRVSLSDLYPNPASWRRLEQQFPENTTGVAAPVDALRLPPEADGLLTMFSALHHFSPEMIRQLLSQISGRRQAALFCDGGGPKPVLLGGILLMPFLFLGATPFLRPFRLSRLLFTYLLPLVPFCTLWDGTVSVLRLYSFRALQQLAAECSTASYHWQAGKFRKFPGVYVYFLDGKPVD